MPAAPKRQRGERNEKELRVQGAEDSRVPVSRVRRVRLMLLCVLGGLCGALVTIYC